jgi:hypothetical protein
VLKDLVNGADGTASFNAPSGGWKTGSGYRVNLVSTDSTTSAAIYAQSNMFNITAGTGGPSVSATASNSGTKT